LGIDLGPFYKGQNHKCEKNSGIVRALPLFLQLKVGVTFVAALIPLLKQPHMREYLLAIMGRRGIDYDEALRMLDKQVSEAPISNQLLPEKETPPVPDIDLREFLARHLGVSYSFFLFFSFLFFSFLFFSFLFFSFLFFSFLFFSFLFFSFLSRLFLLFFLTSFSFIFKINNTTQVSQVSQLPSQHSTSSDASAMYRVVIARPLGPIYLLANNYDHLITQITNFEQKQFFLDYIHGGYLFSIIDDRSFTLYCDYGSEDQVKINLKKQSNAPQNLNSPSSDTGSNQDPSSPGSQPPPPGGSPPGSTGGQPPPFGALPSGGQSRSSTVQYSTGSPSFQAELYGGLDILFCAFQPHAVKDDSTASEMNANDTEVWDDAMTDDDNGEADGDIEEQEKCEIVSLPTYNLLDFLYFIHSIDI
jgi:hypothetical protein